MEGELNVGREIQMSMLPLVFPPFPDRTEFSIFAALEPAREVGGDFYDFFFLDPEHLCVCVGDVSGKGVPSALFAAVTKTLVKSLARVDFSPAGVLTQVNGELADNNESAMFVTMFLGVLNVKSGTFSYCNAGHNPPLVRRRDGAVHGLSERHGPVAGAVPGIAYRESETILRPGDLLLMYTDGVTEATSTALELFAEARLTKVLEGRDDFTVNTVIDDTLAAVHAFEAGAEQADDITLLALAYEGTAGTGIRHVTIRNELSAIAEVQNQVEDFCSQHSIPSRDGRRIAVALDELLSNVISYGFRDSHQHDITIGLHFSGSKFRVTIEDDGIPFNPLDLEKPDVTAALDERNAGGLGIHLVREMLDEVEYQRRGARNFVTIVASITPSDASLNERK
jgi:sigma-B regulation protein RsbU (phosphoserine phosphatase)